MANISLFRKESIRHQFRSQEFGEAVIEQPKLLDRAIAYLGGCILLMGLAASAIPLTSGRAVTLQPAMENYSPVVMSRPAVVERHLLHNGSPVVTDQPVARVRVFSESGDPNVTMLVRSPENGIYFPEQEQGSITSSYKPIAYVLRVKQDNQYSFWQEGYHKSIRSGHLIRLVIDRAELGGRITSVSSLHNNGMQKINVELSEISDKAKLSPQAEVSLYDMKEKQNIFELLGEKP